MKKVLFIVPTLTQTNGVAAFMINYFEHFKFDKFKIEIIYNDLRSSKKYLDFLREKGINTYKLPYERDVGLRKYCKAIRQFFEKHNDYDLIYSNVGYQTYFFYKEAKRHGINNLAIHAHGTKLSDNNFKNALGFFLQKRVNKMSKYKFACSQLAGLSVYGKKSFKVINNAINYDKYKFNKNYRDTIRIRLGIEEKNKIIGFVGRFTPQKNIYFFIDLIKKIDNTYKVLMIGNGYQKQDFLNKVKAENLEDRFIFVEETSYINEYYSTFDFFLLPSLFEGLPVVSVEAQANGLPCMLSNTISNECKISNNTIYLDKDDIKEWISNLKKMSRNSKLKLNDEFNINVQATKFEEILYSILKN